MAGPSSVLRWLRTSPTTVPGINAVPHDDNARYFSVVILGPQDSPYAGTWTAVWFAATLMLAFVCA